MKKRLVSGVVAVTMAAMMACPVFAAWQPSKTVQEVNGGRRSLRQMARQLIWKSQCSRKRQQIPVY